MQDIEKGFVIPRLDRRIHNGEYPEIFIFPAILKPSLPKQLFSLGSMLWIRLEMVRRNPFRRESVTGLPILRPKTGLIPPALLRENGAYPG